MRGGVGLVVQHPPVAFVAGVTPLHQAVQPQALTAIRQLDLVALPADDRAVPGPGTRASQNALRAGQRGLGLRRV